MRRVGNASIVLDRHLDDVDGVKAIVLDSPTRLSGLLTWRFRIDSKSQAISLS
jgi:hypothetical protein